MFCVYGFGALFISNFTLCHNFLLQVPNMESRLMAALSSEAQTLPLSSIYYEEVHTHTFHIQLDTQIISHNLVSPVNQYDIVCTCCRSASCLCICMYVWCSRHVHVGGCSVFPSCSSHPGNIYRLLFPSHGSDVAFMRVVKQTQC